MNCIKHPETASTGTCTGCAEPFCARCLVTIRGAAYCGECKGMAVDQDAIASAGSLGPCPEAKEALIYSIVGLFCFQVIVGPIAVFKAIKARSLISANPRLEGSGKAMFALVLGIVDTLLGILGILAMASKTGSY